MYKWFEIFRTGSHTDSAGRTKEWTEADLDKIADSYDPAKHEAPIVIGHPENDSPAYGWISKLKRHGDRLLALPGSLIPQFVEQLKSGLFKKRSIALNADNTLKHVGFLGAAAPAVKGLKDAEFENAAPTENYIAEFAEPLMFEEKEEPQANQREDEKSKRIQELEKELEQYRRREKISELENFFSGKVNEGILTPAQSEKLQKLSGYIQDERGQEDIMNFVNSLPRQIFFEEIAVKKDMALSASDLIADEIRKQSTKSN